LGWAEIRHPFHPLRGQRFPVLKKRRIAGNDTLILRGLNCGTFSVARECTDWADPSPADSLKLPLRRLDADSLFTLVSILEQMGQVGAVFALEASRLARSNVDWHRLLELCALTRTLVIDEDGSYDPADFNDGLLLGLKGTMAQAELHFLRARLLGGKLNKAQKGELRFPLPVGFCHDEDGHIVPDSDEEVRGAVSLVFRLFRETGSAFAVVQNFARRALRFPKRAYGGAWNGKLVWGRLTHTRVLCMLKNPSYAGVYVFGRYQYHQKISTTGEIQKTIRAVPMPDWRVQLRQHHDGYISWDEFLENGKRLEKNRTNGEATMLSGSRRFGLAAGAALVRELWPRHHRPLHRQRRHLSDLPLQPTTSRRTGDQGLHELSL
jgi:DNA invertase Pin-like site-specific DNA recombinase